MTRELIAYVKPILEAQGVADKFEIMAPREATRASLETITKGENTIAITGNVSARLSDGSVSDPGTGDLRQDAVDREADEWRWIV